MLRTLRPTLLFSVLAYGLALTCPRGVYAQEWLSDRRYSEGIGVKLSEGLVLHPGVGAEVGYDTNVFYASENRLDAARLRVTPHVDLGTLPPQRLGDEGEERVNPKTEFRLSLAAIYQEYFGEDQVVTQRDVGVNAGIRLSLFPQGRWSFTLSDDFTRTNNPTADLGSITAPTDRDQNRAEAVLRYAPGGGNFEFNLGYAFYISYFEREELQQAGNYTMHEVFERIRWRWLPKTALLHEARVSPTFHAGDNRSSTPIRTRIGINGLLTNRLSLLLMAGYGVAFYSDGQDFDSFLAQAELRYIIGPMSNLRVGYERDFHQALIANYYLRDRGYLAYAHMFGGRFLLTLEGSVSSLGFSPILPGAGCGGETGRRDVLLEAGLFGEYRIQDWIAVNASVRQQSDITDYSCSDYPADYSRQEVFAGVRAFY